MTLMWRSKCLLCSNTALVLTAAIRVCKTAWRKFFIGRGLTLIIRSGCGPQFICLISTVQMSLYIWRQHQNGHRQMLRWCIHIKTCTNSSGRAARLETHHIQIYWTQNYWEKALLSCFLNRKIMGSLSYPSALLENHREHHISKMVAQKHDDTVQQFLTHFSQAAKDYDFRVDKDQLWDVETSSQFNSRWAPSLYEWFGCVQ